MARKKSPTLTDSELRLMRIIWELKSCTVNDIVGALPADEPLAYSTVLTTVRILEEKGYLRHEKEGRAFVYEPIVQPRKVRRDALRYVLDRFFNNSPELLVANILANENVSEDVLDSLRRMLDEESGSTDEGTHRSQARSKMTPHDKPKAEDPE